MILQIPIDPKIAKDILTPLQDISIALYVFGIVILVLLLIILFLVWLIYKLYGQERQKQEFTVNFAKQLLEIASEFRLISREIVQAIDNSTNSLSNNMNSRIDKMRDEMKNKFEGLDDNINKQFDKKIKNDSNFKSR